MSGGNPPFRPFSSWEPPAGSISMGPVTVTVRSPVGASSASAATSPRLSPAARTAPTLSAPTLITPPPTPNGSKASPARAPLVPQADCAWAKTTLEEDATLDAQAATEPQYAPWAAYYRDHVQEWDQIKEWLSDTCAGGTPIQVQDEQEALDWLESASQTHVTDEVENPQNRQWDQRWISNYARLESIVRAAAS